MARGDVISRRLTSLIASSALQLTVVYPAVRPAPTGSVATTAPVSPFTGPADVSTVVLAPETPSQASKTVKCLWLDAFSSLQTTMAPDRRTVMTPGWYQGAQAMARVLVSDAALDPTKPLADTIFTGADHVEHQGNQYRVLNVQPVSSSGRVPDTYYVWLTGGAKQ